MPARGSASGPWRGLCGAAGSNGFFSFVNDPAPFGQTSDSTIPAAVAATGSAAARREDERRMFTPTSKTSREVRERFGGRRESTAMPSPLSFDMIVT